jgi:hypothetical protein
MTNVGASISLSVSSRIGLRYHKIRNFPNDAWPCRCRDWVRRGPIAALNMRRPPRALGRQAGVAVAKLSFALGFETELNLGL